MKTSFAAAALALATIGAPSFTSAAATATATADTTTALEADINIVGAKTTAMTPMMRGASDSDSTRSGIVAKIATHDILNRATGLVNKNRLAMDNNVFVSRSNIVTTQNDRIAMAKKVEALVTSSAAESGDEADENHYRTDTATDASTAVLTKNVMTVVGGKDTDAATMSKASAVVAAKGDATMRAQRIVDLVNTVFDAKAQREQMIQTQTARGADTRGADSRRKSATIVIGTKDILRQPTAVINKNSVLSDDQITISRSVLSPTKNDNITLDKGAKVATLVAPASAIDVNARMSAAGADSDSDDKDSKN